MTIVAVHAVPVRLPYRTPMRMAAGDLTSAEHVIVQIHDDSGHVGISEAPARPMFYGESPVSIVHAIEEWFGPSITGADPVAVRRVMATLPRPAANATARAAIDLALHDLAARIFEVPLHRLLGGDSTPVRVSHALGLGDPSALADETAMMREKCGIDCFKVKAAGSIDADVAAIVAVREAAGDGATVFVDANCAYYAHEGLKAIRRMYDAADIAWAEEPVRLDDPTGRARVAAESPVPVLADESAMTAVDCARTLAARHAHMLCVKPARSGVLGSLDVAGLGTASGVKLVLGSQGDSGIGAYAALAIAAAHPALSTLPAELAYALRLDGDVIDSAVEVVDGCMTPPSASGIGVRIDHDLLGRFRIDGR
ncbi:MULTISPECIES: mandelate racemase/muconate lactonizing enzyme family protein [unclassified Rhodococcus (in: high G+C Gram-positive bacteria)]|uniref:mandelate racemase/muconate lactonizing enzyme family protein n=1 Tax=unclassified Rhodococcus (in: high G+C Gram-positive bacteria) TaxID=192944 RepID=UPI001595F5C1|nr:MULTISPECIES: enolase C-terminal domain-like protein [unclassified Rhodococcus (in: high G+C Gram-positive bacteria)]